MFEIIFRPKAIRRLPLVIAVLISLGGCAAVPSHSAGVWAGLEMDGLTLERHGPGINEWFNFHQGGLALVSFAKRPGYIPGPAIPWRIRGEWLEIDTRHDGSFHKRMRAIKVTKDQIVVESPAGTRSVYKHSKTKWLHM